MDTKVATASKLLSRMNDLEHQEVPKELILLGYGDKGTAKTTTMVALAQKIRGEGRILFIDSADGWVSLDNIPSLKRNVTRLRVDDPRELMVISKALRTRAKGFEDFTVVILDEESSWWTDTLHAFAREQAGVSDDEELPIIDWTWYGPPQQAMLNVFKNFTKTPGLHVLVVAHEQDRPIRGESGAVRFGPLLGTKLSAGIGQLSHLVVRFESRKDPKAKGGYRREVQTLPTRYVEAKSRLGDLELKEEVTSFVKKVAAWVNDSALAETVVADEEPTVEDDDEAEDDAETGTDEEDFEVTEDDDEDGE